MDTKTFPEKPIDSDKSSRLPAGSVLKVGDIYVPHPHAEANLPGAGDPRIGDTAAVTEEVIHDAEKNEAHVDSRPLDDIVKPKVVSVAEAGKQGKPEDKKLIVEQPNLTKTETEHQN